MNTTADGSSKGHSGTRVLAAMMQTWTGSVYVPTPTASSASEKSFAMSWDPRPSACSLAPSAFKAWEVLTSEARGAIDGRMGSVIADRIDVLFGGMRASRPEIDTTAEHSCAEAVEQFIIDVAAMTDAQRDGVFAALGSGTYAFFQTVYVYDLDFRLRAALAQLFDEQPDVPDAADPGPSPGAEAADLWPALDRFLTEVATLSHLDPVTTELIRLRGARAHNCRICQSRREVRAITEGAGDSTWDKIDLFEWSDLDERYKVALRLTDAVLWQPAAYPAGLADQVRATFTPEETVEMVLDLVRNAANKVAVALQADQAVIASGVEYFSVSPVGTLRYGLPAPVGATRQG